MVFPFFPFFLAGFTPRGMTPRAGGMTPGTAVRDSLSINREEAFLDKQENQKQQQMELKNQLLSGLQNLPKPSNDFEIVVPDVRVSIFFVCEPFGMRR